MKLNFCSSIVSKVSPKSKLASLGFCSTWVFALAGCGGTSSPVSAGVGQAALVIKWPARTSKLIPVDSNAITVTFSNSTGVIASQTVSRPAARGSSTFNFTGLPTGSLTLTANAYPSFDGSGNPQASASESVTIVAATTSPITLSMASTIASLAVSPSSTSISVGSQTPLTATALDSSGNVVLTSASTITYASSNGSVAVVNSTGIITGVAAGSANITCLETESGKKSVVTVTVTATATG
jgi:hypothetical protein